MVKGLEFCKAYEPDHLFDKKVLRLPTIFFTSKLFAELELFRVPGLFWGFLKVLQESH